jgi:hypothetical protein
MKPPVLRIKKRSVIYDDTEARQEGEPFRPSFSPSPSRRTVRRRRVGSRSSLLPLLVVAAGLFIFFRVLPHAPTSRAVVAGWQVTLHVTPWEDALIVGLTFVSRSAKAGGSAPQEAAAVPEAAVRVSLPGTGEQVFLAGDLARSPMTLSGRLPAIPGAARVQADVTILGSRATLLAPVGRPASSSASPR